MMKKSENDSVKDNDTDPNDIMYKYVYVEEALNLLSLYDPRQPLLLPRLTNYSS